MKKKQYHWITAEELVKLKKNSVYTFLSGVAYVLN